MAKKSSKKDDTKNKAKSAVKSKAEGNAKSKTKLGFKNKVRQKFVEANSSKNPHKSFKRTYREDYLRELEAPGIFGHIVETFKTLFSNWRLFLPLLLIFSVLAVVLVGFMGQDAYRNFQTSLEQTAANGAEELNPFLKAGVLLISTVSSGGLFGSSGEAAGVFGVLVFLLIWLVTAFALRQILAGRKIGVRDALYNSMSPLISTLVVFLVVAIQAIPVVIFIVALSSAVETNFMSTPFYALLFVGFSALLILLSTYLWSSSLIALVAVTAPGLYPLEALKAASDLMFGRRIKLIIRLVALVFTLVLMWVIIMIPLILIDLWLKNFDWASGVPFIPLCLVVLTCFTAMFSSTYIYLYYRFLLGFDQKNN